MTKKLLVIFGMLGVGAFIFRDRIIAGALAVAGKANQFAKEVKERSLELNGDGADFVAAHTREDER